MDPGRRVVLGPTPGPLRVLLEGVSFLSGEDPVVVRARRVNNERLPVGGGPGGSARAPC